MPLKNSIQGLHLISFKLIIAFDQGIKSPVCNFAVIGFLPLESRHHCV